MHKPYFCYLREVVSLFLALTQSPMHFQVVGKLNRALKFTFNIVRFLYVLKSTTNATGHFIPEQLAH